MMGSDDPIPPAALAALRERWQQRAGPLFSEVLTNHPERRADPSYYHHGTDGDDDADADGVPDAVAVALVRDGVFGPLAYDHGSSVAINEHAEHAFSDFCGEVYEAWDRFRARLGDLPRR